MLPLKDFISKGVEAQKERITEISDLAAKEYTLEKSLAKMQEEWKKQEFTIIVKKDKQHKNIVWSQARRNANNAG